MFYRSSVFLSVLKHRCSQFKNEKIDVYVLCRSELEADHIGILLLAAAGVDPIIAVLVWQNKAKIRRESTLTEFLSYFSTHPSSKKRWQFLSQPKVMDEALELYKMAVTSHNTRLIN